MEMHGAEVCQLRQVSNDSSDQNKCSIAKMEQPTVIISQASRIQSVGHPVSHLNIHQPHIAYGGGDLEPLSYQHIDHHQNVWASYNEDTVQHPYSQRSLVITQTPGLTANSNQFSPDVNEMRDHLYQPAPTMDHNNNHTLHQTVDEVIASTLKEDEHCIHASPVSHHGGSHNGSPEHGPSNSNVQFLNLGSAQNTISENLSQLKYQRHTDQQGTAILVAAHSDSRSSPVSQASEYESDLQNFTQLTSVVPTRNNNNLSIYSPTSQAGGYDNVR